MPVVGIVVGPVSVSLLSIAVVVAGVAAFVTAAEQCWLRVLPCWYYCI